MKFLFLLSQQESGKSERKIEPAKFRIILPNRFSYQVVINIKYGESGALQTLMDKCK